MVVKVIVVVYNIGAKVFALYIKDLDSILAECGHEAFDRCLHEAMGWEGWSRAVKIVGNVLIISGQSPDYKTTSLLSARGLAPDALKEAFFQIINGKDGDAQWMTEHHELVDEQNLRMLDIFDGKITDEYIANRDLLGELTFRKSLNHTVFSFEVEKGGQSLEDAVKQANAGKTP